MHGAANTAHPDLGVRHVCNFSSPENRVPEPANPWFAVMTPIRFRRLATNLDQSEDCKFTGSITGTTLTVTDVDTGTIEAGANIFGAGVAVPTTIIEQLTGGRGEGDAGQ